QEAEAPRELDKCGPTIGSETHPGGVLVVRDRVEQLRAEAAGEPAFQLADVEALVVERDRHELRLEAAERLDRSEVGRRLDHHHVAAVEKRLADEGERLDAAARDQQLVVGRPQALQPLEPRGERVERSGKPARRRVLERTRLSGLGELVQQGGDPLARKRLRSGEPARERDDVRATEEREHGGDPVADVPARALGCESLPASRVERDGHAANPRTAGSRTAGPSSRGECQSRLRVASATSASSSGRTSGSTLARSSAYHSPSCASAPRALRSSSAAPAAHGRLLSSSRRSVTSTISLDRLERSSP